MTVEVVVPWAGGCRYRDAALRWVADKLDGDGYPTTLAKAPPDPWVKARALWPAITESAADIVVMHDADVWSADLDWAIREVEAGAPWAMPHDRVRRLNRESTGRLLEGAATPLDALPLVENHRAMWGGGIVVLPRDTYLSCPLDPRFVGWGCEDLSWANALWFLAGEGWRGTGDLYHLWHPPQRRLSRARGSAENHRLAARYRQARFRPNEMRALVNEALEVLGADRSVEQAVPDPVAVRVG